MKTREYTQKELTELAGAGRKLVATLAADSLIHSSRLTLDMIPALRAIVVARSLVFPGEELAANQSRPVYKRERELASIVTAQVDDHVGGCGSVHEEGVLLTPNEALRVDRFQLMAKTLKLATEAIPFFYLPTGSWVTDLVPRRKGEATQTP